MNNCLYKLSSPIPSDLTDYVDGFLFENAPTNWFLEENRLTGEGLLVGVFSSKEDMLLHKANIINGIGALVNFCFSDTTMDNKDWNESYKDHFIPWSYHHFHLIPVWLKDSYKVPTNNLSLFLDPGMAFGTGNHESTRMCLEFLIEKELSSQNSHSMIDLGCGSGILSLSACLLGYKNILGIDNDQDAVRISKDNALLNQLDQKVIFKTSNLYDIDKSLGTFDCVVANIQADILISCAERIFQLTHKGTTIILSGILSKEIDQVIQEFNRFGLDTPLEYSLKHLGEWSSVQFFKN